jgi:S1-C subfamily serine protease
MRETKGIKAGTRVRVLEDGRWVEAKVVGFGEKNDRPLVDLEIEGSDELHWRYLTQLDLGGGR